MQLSTSSGVRNKSGPSATLGLGLDLAAAGIGYAFPRTMYVVLFPRSPSAESPLSLSVVSSMITMAARLMCVVAQWPSRQDSSLLIFFGAILPRETQVVDSFERSRPLTLHGARGRDDDGVAASREDCSSGYRRCRC